MALNNFAAVADINAPQRYTLRISGTPEIRLPISSWQATVQRGRQSFVQAVVPAYADGALSGRVGSETFSIYAESTIGGSSVSTLLASAPLETVRINQSAFRSTAVLTGYSSAFFDAPDSASAPKALSDVQLITATVNGSTRIRCAIDWFVRPGQQVTANGYTLTVDYANFYATSAGLAYMDIGDRG